MHCLFGVTKNKHDYYRGKNYMKFCRGLRKHAIKIINYKIKKSIALTNEENQSYHEQGVCYICKKYFSTNENDKKYYKAKDN